ncbi:COX15/CtaA family protein, partial [Streptomyces cavourensis]|nr:COX15/CtaA family protein [Streptomyces cavourensis]
MVRVETPISAIAKRWTPSTRIVKRAALSAVMMSVLIIVTGGAVRLTGSGLGCDTWPKCTDDSLFATPEQGLHGAIEFGNRMLTYVLSAAVGWAIVAVSSMKPRRRKLTRLAWSQFWIVLGNAVLGGITVWAGLNPWTVAGHFLLANALLAVTVITWVRIGEGDGPARPRAPLPVRRLAAGQGPLRRAARRGRPCR